MNPIYRRATMRVCHSGRFNRVNYWNRKPGVAMSGSLGWFATKLYHKQWDHRITGLNRPRVCLSLVSVNRDCRIYMPHNGEYTS